LKVSTKYFTQSLEVPNNGKVIYCKEYAIIKYGGKFCSKHMHKKCKKIISMVPENIYFIYCVIVIL